MTAVDVVAVSGPAVAPYLDDVARLRIAVFREWPYLYDGDAAYEARYLRALARTPRSVLVLARADGGIVGASTGMPLDDETPAFRAPFVDAGRRTDDVFYLAESVLLPAFRGRGLGHAFFDAREAHARALGGFAWTAFAAVDRAVDDPRRPADHRGNEVFWRKRGYERRPGLTMSLDWAEAGARDEVAHRLTCWTRPLD